MAEYVDHWTHIERNFSWFRIGPHSVRPRLADVSCEGEQTWLDDPLRPGEWTSMWHGTSASGYSRVIYFMSDRDVAFEFRLRFG